MQNICMNKKIFSWAMYDWANSVFYTTVMAGFFPVFFKKYWSDETSAALSTERLGWALALSGFLLAIMAPIFGVISDKRQLKKKLLFSTMVIGCACSAGLFFVPQGNWSMAVLLYGTGMFMASSSAVFYDSLMTTVCREDQYDFVSSLGYAMGYLGGGLLFALNVAMTLKPEFFGIPDAATAVRISFLMVGAWWFIFTLPLMKYVPEPEIEKNDKTLKILVRETFKELVKLFNEIKQNKNLFYFVIGYWFYIDGVYTVMTMAVDFGLTLGLESSDLIKALLITQFVGFPAAYAFGMLSSKVNSRNLIFVCLIVYFISIIAASKMSSASHFYALAAIIGLFQGGVQALSRSLFALLIPVEKSGEYFGFFNMLGKFASVIGPALIAISAGIIKKYDGDIRNTILSLLILIVAGSYFLLKVKVKPRLA
jgi:MFS transporter, UMF1 family